LLFLTQDVYLNNLNGLGGVLILAIGIELLDIQKIKILNMLPSLVYLPLVIYISGLL